MLEISDIFKHIVMYFVFVPNDNHITDTTNLILKTKHCFLLLRGWVDFVFIVRDCIPVVYILRYILSNAFEQCKKQCEEDKLCVTIDYS